MAHSKDHENSVLTYKKRHFSSWLRSISRWWIFARSCKTDRSWLQVDLSYLQPDSQSLRREHRLVMGWVCLNIGVYPRIDMSMGKWWLLIYFCWVWYCQTSLSTLILRSLQSSQWSQAIELRYGPRASMGWSTPRSWWSFLFIITIFFAPAIKQPNEALIWDLGFHLYCLGIYYIWYDWSGFREPWNRNPPINLMAKLWFPVQIPQHQSIINKSHWQKQVKSISFRNPYFSYFHQKSTDDFSGWWTPSHLQQGAFAYPLHQPLPGLRCQQERSGALGVGRCLDPTGEMVPQTQGFSKKTSSTERMGDFAGIFEPRFLPRIGGFSPWLFHHYFGIVHAICIGKMRMDHVIGGPVFRQSHHLQSSRSSIMMKPYTVCPQVQEQELQQKLHSFPTCQWGSLDFVRVASTSCSLGLRPQLRAPDLSELQISVGYCRTSAKRQRECQIECQNRCQKECQNVCRKYVSIDAR